ncbi:MAG TPA: universal stress protein [Kiloniellales bacterium]|nr:universal stress protein [Kiloniellales bacterium]
MKTLLVPLEESEGVRSMLQTAWLAAKMFNSYVEGLYIRRALPGVVVADIGGYAAATPDLMESFEEEDARRGQRVRETFEAFLREKEVPLGAEGPAGDAPTAGWCDDNQPGDSAIGMYARLFDLTVVGRPVAGTSAPAMSTLETVLFDSGRPILIAPPEPPEGLGRCALIHWNGSTETARTLAFGLPVLRRFERVVLVAVEGVMVPGPSAAEAATNLRRNGLKVELREIPAEGRNGGEAVLNEAARLGADLVVKGAYTHSRLRQMIFGGATSHILAESTLPVLMAH